jgi:hypothetical protein
MTCLKTKQFPLNFCCPEFEESPFIDDCEVRDDDELGTTSIAPEANELLPVEADVSAPVP